MGQIPGGYSGGQVVRGSQSGGWDEDLEGAGGSSIQHQVRVRVAYHGVASSPRRGTMMIVKLLFIIGRSGRGHLVAE